MNNYETQQEVLRKLIDHEISLSEAEKRMSRIINDVINDMKQLWREDLIKKGV